MKEYAYVQTASAATPTISFNLRSQYMYKQGGNVPARRWMFEIDIRANRDGIFVFSPSATSHMNTLIEPNGAHPTSSLVGNAFAVVPSPSQRRSIVAGGRKIAVETERGNDEHCTQLVDQRPHGREQVCLPCTFDRRESLNNSNNSNDNNAQLVA